MFKYQFRTGQDLKLPDTAALIVFVNQKQAFEEAKQITERFRINFSEGIRTRLQNPDYKEVRYYPENTHHELIMICKYDTDTKFSNNFFRNYLSGIVEFLDNEGIRNLYLNFPQMKEEAGYFKNKEHLQQSCIEGLILGSYAFDKYKSKQKDLKTLTVYLEGEKNSLLPVIQKTQAVTDSIIYARNLINEPSGVLTPDSLAKRIRKDMQRYKITSEVFNEKELLRQKMNGIYAVGKGSANPPRLIILNYKPAKRKAKVCLVGKGVTFDSGGISIKPGPGMSEMKGDMSGGAVTAAVIMAAARLKLPIEITGLIPAVENMPSGSSFKPGDIIVTRSGQSIEVDNTDAEGRIILADALDYAKDKKPDVIIDIATLTGSVVVALGDATAGLYTNSDELAESLYKAGQTTFERVWRMPMWNEFDDLIKSDVADMKNLGGKWGGSISAAKFLQRFTDEKIQWAHLDIAGPAMPHDLSNYTKKYMTGFGVRLLLEYLESI